MFDNVFDAVEVLFAFNTKFIRFDFWVEFYFEVQNSVFTCYSQSKPGHLQHVCKNKEHSKLTKFRVNQWQ